GKDVAARRRAAVAEHRVAEIEIHAEAAGADTAAVVALHLRGARGDVARGEVAERGIHAFEVIVALVLGNVRGLARCALFSGPPAAPVVAQRLGHERELALETAGDRDARRVNLREAWVSH